MLLNVADDRDFQSYLDRMEQLLHYHKFPLFCACVHLHSGNFRLQHSLA